MRKLIFVFLWILSLPLAAAPAFEDLSFDEKLGQTLVVFVDVDSAELVRPAIEAGKSAGC